MAHGVLVLAFFLEKWSPKAMPKQKPFRAFRRLLYHAGILGLHAWLVSYIQSPFRSGVNFWEVFCFFNHGAHGRRRKGQSLGFHVPFQAALA